MLAVGLVALHDELVQNLEPLVVALTGSVNGGGGFQAVAGVTMPSSMWVSIGLDFARKAGLAPRGAADRAGG